MCLSHSIKRLLTYLLTSFPSLVREPARPDTVDRPTLSTPSPAFISSCQIGCWGRRVMSARCWQRRSLDFPPKSPTHAVSHPHGTAPCTSRQTSGVDRSLPPLGDPRRVDWTASDGAKGRGDVASRLLVLCDLQLD